MAHESASASTSAAMDHEDHEDEGGLQRTLHKDHPYHELDAHDSTLCEFEHFWKPYVDFGLAIFSLVGEGPCNFTKLKLFFNVIKFQYSN